MASGRDNTFHVEASRWIGVPFLERLLLSRSNSGQRRRHSRIFQIASALLIVFQVNSAFASPFAQRTLSTPPSSLSDRNPHSPSIQNAPSFKQDVLPAAYVWNLPEKIESSVAAPSALPSSEVSTPPPVSNSLIAASVRSALPELTSSLRPDSYPALLIGATPPAAGLTFTPASAAFGPSTVGLTSNPITITAHNNTGSAVTFLSSTGMAPFSLSRGNCPSLTGGTFLAVGRSCTFTATFSPTPLGPVSGNIVFSTSAGPVTYSFSGSGAQGLVFVPAAANFGKVPVNTTSKPIVITVHNYTTSPVTYVSSTGPTLYSVQDGTCHPMQSGLILNAGQSCTFSATFAPIAVGPTTGSLTLNTASGPVTLQSSGTGEEGLTFSPTAANFGNVPVGSTSAPITVMMHNYTTGPISFLSSSGSPPFVIKDSTCHSMNNGTILNSAGTCTFTATFTPTVSGPSTGSITFNTPSGPITFTGTGNGITPHLIASAGGPYKGIVGQALSFDGSKSVAPSGQTLTSYAWTFGDGSTGTGVNPTHAYAGTGTFPVTVKVTASGGGTNSASTTATIAAAVSPLANAGGPYSGIVNVPIQFDGSASTAPAGRTLKSYVWNFGDGTTGTGVQPVHSYGGVGPFTVALTVTDSANATGMATTTASNSNQGTPLSISASASPAPNAAGWNNTPVTVTFTCTDAVSPVTNCPAARTISTAGANQNIAVTGKDKAGNVASAQITLNIELAPPTITASISPKVNAAGWTDTVTTVTFLCTPSTSPIATCTPPTTLNSEVSGQTVTGSTIDLAGFTANTSTTVSLDLTPPVLNVASPVNGATIALNSPSIAISGTASDSVSGLSTVTCNGIPASISGAAFSCTSSLVAGANSIAILATDIAGNTTTVTRALTYAPAPQISISAPVNLAVTNITPVTVNGTISDPSASLTINGIAVPQSSGSFSTPVPLVEGLNILSAVATNPAGTSGAATVQVTLDTTPPHITIDSPIDGTTTTAASVTVSGLANDIVVGTVNSQDVQVSVNGLPAQVANRSYSVTNVPLALGPNTIRATGRDRAGNGTTTSVIVTRALASNPPAPAIGHAVLTEWLNVVSGDNQSGIVGAPLATPIVVSLTDSTNHPVPNQVVIFKVTGDNGLVSNGAPTGASAVAVTTDGKGQASVTWTLGLRSGAGLNLLQVSSALAVSPVTLTATGNAGAASQIVVDSGNNQTGPLSTPLTFPFVADVVDAGHNRVAGVPVTFTIKRGTGNFAGATSFVVNTDSNGRAIAVLTLGSSEGINNNVVEANFTGNPGFPAAFVASAMTPGNPANTSITGIVLDNSNNPIQGVTIRLYQTNQGNANNLPVQVGTPVQTNAQGTFLISGAPVGTFKLMADGTTVPGTKTYPTLEYDVVAVAGANNTVGMPIYLQPLDTVNKICVDETHGGVLTLPQYPGFSLTVPAGSATFPGGSRSGCVSATPVNGDKVPMAPGFGQQPRFIVTIQPVGTTFSPPAAITLPNVDGLKPRAVTEMYSYDHDLGMFVAIGTGTVSNDGSQIVSNPGVGVLKAGWHCGGDPNTTGSAGTCPTCQTCQGDGCEADPSQDGQPAPDDKCMACKDGSLEKIEFDETKVTTSYSYAVPSEIVSDINDALEDLKEFGIIAEINPLTITGESYTQKCCSKETGLGMKTGGSVSGNFGSFDVQAKIYPPGPIPEFKGELNVGFATLTLSADFIGGVFLGLEGSVEGTIGHHQSDCDEDAANRAGCYYGSLKTSLTPSLSAKIGGSVKLECEGTCLGITEIEGKATATLGEVSIQFNISDVSYNSEDDCTTGLHGGVFQFEDGEFKIEAEVEATISTGLGDFGYSKEFEFLKCTMSLASGVSCE